MAAAAAAAQPPEDMLGRLLSAGHTEEDMQLLAEWCDIALEALQAPDAETHVQPAALVPIVRSQLYLLRSSSRPEQRVLLLLVVLNCNANFRQYLGSRSDPLVYPAFLRHLDEACQHLLMGTRADRQPVLRPQDAEFSGFDVFVHRMRLAYLTYHMQPLVQDGAH